MRLFTFSLEGVKKLRGLARRRGLNLTIMLALVTVLLCAGLVYTFEREQGGSIATFGDALWWALATITTVGYGDVIPRSLEGRGIAVFLMIVGITFFSVLTANIAAFLVESDERDSASDVNSKLDQIIKRLDALEGNMRSGNQPTTDQISHVAENAGVEEGAKITWK